MKNPNGYGTVVKLSGNRRRPYAVRKTLGFDGRGYPIYETIGYTSTRREGLILLAQYNQKPWDVQNRRASLAEVYALWEQMAAFRNMCCSYCFIPVSLTETVLPAPTTLNIEGVKVEMKDQNGKVLPIGEGEIEIIAVDRDGVPTKGKVAEDGTVTFDPFAIPEAGEYYYYISMTEGEDEKIAYSKDVFCIAVEAKAVDGELKTELKGIMNGNYEAESVIFKVVKTVEEPGTGDTTQIWLWVALVAVAALAAGAAIVLRRKAVQK